MNTYWLAFFSSRSLINVMKSCSHLMEVDALSLRSCLYLMSLGELTECSTELKAELLDMLHAFFIKAPQEVTASNMQVNANRRKSILPFSRCVLSDLNLSIYGPYRLTCVFFCLFVFKWEIFALYIYTISIFRQYPTFSPTSKEI